VGADAWKSVDEACDNVVQVASRMAANRADSQMMQSSYRTYRKLYPALHQAFS
jgi:hypothetical protein